MKVSADNRLPADTDVNLAFSLYAIFRDFAKQINALTEEVMSTSNHSEVVAADALVKTGAGKLKGFNVIAVTAVGTIDIRDGITAGGGAIIDTIQVGTAAGTRVREIDPINVETGIYIDYNGGATGSLVILYE